jgi:putative transposase
MKLKSSPPRLRRGGLSISQEELWQEVKVTEEEIWGDLKRETLLAAKTLLETSMQVQVNDLIGSAHWKHNPYRQTYRNGYYKRSLLTSFGYISDINVPRVRDGSLRFNVFQKYKRRAPDIDKMLLEMFLNGVSTRKVEEVLTPLYGPHAVSAGLVSKVTKVLNEQVEKFHSRKLKDEYEYLILDGIFVKAKSPIKVKNRCILIAYGIKSNKVNGKIKYTKEFIDFYLAPKGESENAWVNFLYRLYHRGLEGKNLKVITIDGNKGLYNAVNLVYPLALIQSCWVHKMRNVAKRLPRKVQVHCLEELKQVYKAKSYNKALVIYRDWFNRWWNISKEAVLCVEKDIEQLLNFYKFPEELWKKIRTTNPIERSFREVRRRIRTMSCFQNRDSLERIIFAIITRLNKKWGNEYFIKEDSLFYKITQIY